MGQPHFGLRGNALTVWLTIACSTDIALFGYDQGVFSGTVVADDFLIRHGIQGNPQLISIVTAIYDIGCFVGAIAAVVWGDKLGRKKAILLGTTILAIGAALQTTSYSYAHMFVGRVIAGIGNGLNTSTAPVWQVDSSKTSWRGRLVMIELAMNIAGFALVNWINYGLSFVGGQVSWRVPLALQFIFIIVLFLTVPWLPESPRWLMAQGRETEAITTIALIEDRDVQDPVIVMVANDIKWALDFEKENSPTWCEFLSRKKTDKGNTAATRRALLGIGLHAMQQFSGINVTSYYLPTVLIESVGLDNSRARLLTACNSLSYLFFTCLAVFFIDKLGRRKMLMGGAVGQALSYLFITITLARSEMSSGAETEQWASASIAFFFAFYVFWGFGWQGTSWLYPTEINSLAMRQIGTGLGVATNWLVNFMVLITPIGIANLGWRFYIIWCIFNAAFVPIIYLFYPETANRPLEDLDRYFAEANGIIVAFDKAAVSTKRPAVYTQEEADQVAKLHSVDPADKMEKSDYAAKHVNG